MPTYSKKELSSGAELRRKAWRSLLPCSVELHLRGVALAERLPTARRNSHQELSSAERRGARSSLQVELHPWGVALAECDFL